jgi:hypothetical protein
MRDDEAFWASFALAYHRLENDPHRNGQSVLARLATQYGVPRTTITSWLRTARRCGYLSPTSTGKRGGELSASVANVLYADCECDPRSHLRGE